MVQQAFQTLQVTQCDEQGVLQLGRNHDGHRHCRLTQWVLHGLHCYSNSE